MATRAENLKFLRDLVYRRSAITLDGAQARALLKRLSPLLVERSLGSLDELFRLLRDNPDSALATQVVEALVTDEACFFRDFHPFEALRLRIVPELMKSRASVRTLRIWCAAASSGQEPYSVAESLREAFPELVDWSLQIIGTDLKALDEGPRRQVTVTVPPPPMPLKYVDLRGIAWEIKPELQAIVRFQELNLAGDWSGIEGQDVVLMRNVLDGFDAETKRRILGRVRETLAPDGFLILGPAETTASIESGYEAVRLGSGAYFQPSSQRVPRVA